MRKDKTKLKKEAEKQVRELFSQAKSKPGMANRYVALAKKIAMKVNYRIPSIYRRRFCRHCYTYFTSENSKVRTRNKMLVMHCDSCKKLSRFGLKTKASSVPQKSIKKKTIKK
jgi:ribonuclease P protein subunit RPR2